jgi:hypothetical protein
MSFRISADPYFRYHSLRHFGASVVAHPGVPLTAIQQILGHHRRAKSDHMQKEGFGYYPETLSLSWWAAQGSNLRPAD